MSVAISNRRSAGCNRSAAVEPRAAGAQPRAEVERTLRRVEQRSAGSNRVRESNGGTNKHEPATCGMRLQPLGAKPVAPLAGLDEFGPERVDPKLQSRDAAPPGHHAQDSRRFIPRPPEPGRGRRDREEVPRMTGCPFLLSARRIRSPRDDEPNATSRPPGGPRPR